MKYLLLSLCLLCHLYGLAQDSVMVVKGQVSDYYIPIYAPKIIEGQIVDEQNNPIEGATVMFVPSPTLYNTPKDGLFNLSASHWDSVLKVYTPGKEIAYYNFEKANQKTDIKSGDTLFYAGSTCKGFPVWYNTDPKIEKFNRKIGKNALPTWNPAFLLDDDGKLYQYNVQSLRYPGFSHQSFTRVNS